MSSDLWEDVRRHYVDLKFVAADARPAPLPKARMCERITFLQEELTELCAAVDDNDLCAQADALVDLVVVALGTAAQLGLPWPACWAEVLRANRAKVPGVGKRGMALDLVKPPGWKAPDHAPLLTAAGYAIPRRDINGDEIDDDAAPQHADVNPCSICVRVPGYMPEVCDVCADYTAYDAQRRTKET